MGMGMKYTYIVTLEPVHRASESETRLDLADALHDLKGDYGVELVAESEAVREWRDKHGGGGASAGATVGPKP